MSTTTFEADFTTEEAATILKIGPQKVRAFIHAGELEAYDVRDGAGQRPQWRIPREALDEFKRRRMPRAKPKRIPRRRDDDGTIEFF